MHMGQVAPEMQGQNGEHELAVAQSQLLLPLARQTNLRLDRRRPGPGQKFAPKHSLEVKPVPGTYARQEANGKHVRLLHQHFTLDLAGWVENGRKTAEARSKNVCNAGCCCLFFFIFQFVELKELYLQIICADCSNFVVFWFPVLYTNNFFNKSCEYHTL